MKLMADPRTARELAEELAPLLEALANIRYLIERGHAELSDHEAVIFGNLVQQVLRALKE